MKRKIVIFPEQLHSHVPGGIGIYTTEVLRHFATLAQVKGLDLKIFGSRLSGDSDPFLQFGVPVGQTWLNHRQLMRAWDLGLYATSNDTFATISFSMAGPTGGTQVRRLVTVYDLAFQSVPETFTARGRRWHEARLASIRKSRAKVVTISEQSQKQLVNAGFSLQRIILAEPGADHLAAADLAGTHALLETLGIHSDFLLTVGTLEPRKNLSRVFEAVAKSRLDLGAVYPLVVVGPRGWGSSMRSTPGIHIIGHVRPEVLAGLYRLASALIYVPLFEGFGLPPIEAMSACTPVIASQLPSTATTNCAIVDPYSIDDIARGICKVISDDQYRSSLVRDGLIKVSTMRWTDTARAIVDGALSDQEQ